MILIVDDHAGTYPTSLIAFQRQNVHQRNPGSGAIYGAGNDAPADTPDA